MINAQLDLYVLRMQDNKLEVLLDDNKELPNLNLNENSDIAYQLGVLSKQYLSIDDGYLNFRPLDIFIVNKILYIPYMVLIYNTLVPKHGGFYLLESITNEYNTKTLLKIKNII
jgi:hypothetical protein